MTASEAGKIATILRDAALAGLRAGQPQVLGNPAEAPARIVEWIDTTVMRRRLTFTFDTGAVLHLEAAGRRLVRLMDPAPSSLPPPQAALFGKALEPGDADDVAAILSAVCDGADHVTVGSGVIPDAADPTETGLATASLSEALGPPRNGATEDGRLASFLDHAADDLPCAMRVAATGPRRSGAGTRTWPTWPNAPRRSSICCWTPIPRPPAPWPMAACCACPGRTTARCWSAWTCPALS